MRTKRFYIALGLIPFSIALIGFVTLLNSPYLGIEFKSQGGKWLISNVDLDGPAAILRDMIGKEIAAIGDLRLGAHDLVEDFDYIPDRDSLTHFWEAQRYFSEEIKVGQSLYITLNPMPTNPEFRIIPSSFPISKAVSRSWPMYFSGLFSIIVGLMVAVKRPHDFRARIFYLLTLTLGSVILTFACYASRNISIDYRVFTASWIINSIAFPYSLILFLHFCLLFPVGKQAAHNPVFVTLLYLIPAAVAIVFQSRIYFFTLPLLSISSFALGAPAMAHSYISLRYPLEKAQIRWVMWGSGIVATVVLISYLPSFFTEQKLISDSVPALFFILIPLSIAFAITKYRLMDIDTLFDNTLVYSVTLGLLVLIDMGVISSLIKLRVVDLNTTNPFIAVAILVWTVIFAYLPVREKVKVWIKKALKREIYDLNDVSMRLSARLLSAVDVPSVIKTAEGIINETLHPKVVETVLIDQNLPRPLFAKEGSNISPFVKGGSRGILEIKEPRQLFPQEDIPGDYSGGVVIPLTSPSGSLGCFILSNKHSEHLYSREDMKLLNIVAGQAALAVEGIYNAEEARKKEMEAREDRERISREIHDGMGTCFTNAIMMIDMLDREVSKIEEKGEQIKYLKLK